MGESLRGFTFDLTRPPEGGVDVVLQTASRKAFALIQMQVAHSNPMVPLAYQIFEQWLPGSVSSCFFD